MSKKYSTTTTLVIVESPAKCKKIEEYLGPGYKCLATYGHLRELQSLKNIDMENNFTPTYTIVENSIKKRQIETLKKAIKTADNVILALDGDREGEKIAYCVAQIFKLDIHKTSRITFHEITETSIRHAIQNPRIIDMNLVNAQQSRQILDILVGFKISPMLWKCISNSKGKENALSAGRCQTPALRLIYDNYKEICEAKEKSVYNVTGYFTNSNIPFELNSHDKYETSDTITDFLIGSDDFSHIYTCSKPIQTIQTPPEPFTTSKIQQVASNELHYSPKETMRICQLLYEGGYITYMRTDSKTYSGEFLEKVGEYIRRSYAQGDKYDGINRHTMDRKMEDNSNRQEAHEAIRPTTISLIELPETMGSKERKMYKLIWENTVESCMTSASYRSITAKITSFQNNTFTYTTELIDFPGWKIVAKKYSTENKEYHYLQTIKQNSIIPYKKICCKSVIKGCKQHYTEARLVHLLEERGIGRPSTFSSLVDKIQERNYVKKEDIKGKEILCVDYELENGEIFEIETKREFGNEKGKLVLQPLGKIVMEFLEEHFDKLFNYDYTNQMENALDKIAKGELLWHSLCENCNNEIDTLVEKLATHSKLEIKIDENNTYIVGKYGPVIKCIETIDGKEEISFKPIKTEVDVKLLEKGNFTTEDIIDTTKKATSQFIIGQYNGKDVILKKGKYGIYVTCGEISKTLKELGNRPIENITFVEVTKYLEEGCTLVREINKSISIRKGPKGDYLFYKSNKMSKPKFYDITSFVKETSEDYKICDINIVKSWIKEKYNLYY